MDMTQNKLAAAVAAPAPIPAPAPTTIPIALTGWSPSNIAEMEAAGISEVSMDPHELMYMPAPALVHVHVRTPPPTAVLVPVHLAAPATPMPMRAPPQRHGTPPSTVTSQRRQLSSSRAPPIDRAMT